MILEKIFNIIITLFVAIIVHEIGHWLWYWRNKGQKFNLQLFYNNPISFGFKSVWNVEITPQEEQNGLLFGITAGLVVVILVMLSSSGSYMMYALPVYMAGCRHDLQRIIEIIKSQNLLVKHRLKVDQN